MHVRLSHLNCALVAKKINVTKSKGLRFKGRKPESQKLDSRW